jgi:serine/threonine protein kinase
LPGCRRQTASRHVALKVLPAFLLSDQQRLGRFEREAQLLAALNHPNIAGIYGPEDSAGVFALVMELVEGQTLAERIMRALIAVEEALQLAKQLADALEYAHERGIVHRDLKPANLKVRDDDMLKVLDFGIAKALADDPATADIHSSLPKPKLVKLGIQRAEDPRHPRGISGVAIAGRDAEIAEPQNPTTSGHMRNLPRRVHGLSRRGAGP